MWFMHESAGWWMIFSGVWMILFWGGLIGLIIWGITRLTDHSNFAQKQQPQDIAKERYAKGKISKEFGGW